MATIEFNCGSCGHHYKVPVSAAGRKAKCKECGAGIQVPAPGGQVDDDIILKEVDPPLARQAPGRSSASRNNKRPAAKGKPAPRKSAPRKPDLRKPAAKRESVDLASLYAAEEEPVVEESALDALASASGASFDFEASAGPSRGRNRPTKKKSGPPLPLLIGAGGGAALLLIVVVVLVIVLGGGGDEEEPSKAGLTIADNPRPNTSRTNDRTPEPEDEPEAEVEVEPEVEETPEALPSVVTRPGSDEGLVDWTIKVDRAVAEAARQIERAGVVFTAPTSWIERSKPVDNEGPQISDLVVLSPDETVRVSVIVGKYGMTKPPDWPSMLMMEQTPTDWGPDELIFGKPVPFRGPHEFMFVPDYVKEPVSFGTLFGGYRFTRFATGGKRSDNTEIQTIQFLGTVGSLYIHIVVAGEGADAAALAEAEWIARSARLMTESGISEFAKKSPLFQDWVKEQSTTVPRLDDLPPVASASPAAWAGFGEASEFKAMMAMAGASGPIRSPYRIAPPAGLEPAATSRLAVRWRPNEQGLWMAMEVVDLGSRWRREESPMLSTDRAMIAGREMAIPAGTETSEMEVDGMKVHRLLFPESPVLDFREVYYVTLDHGVLVTVLGRYAKDRPEDLAKLDTAVGTLGKR